MARVRDAVLPDVAISRRQLLTLFPEVCPPSSLAYHSASAGVQEGESLLQVMLGLSRASAQLATSLEPREHGATSPVSYIRPCTCSLRLNTTGSPD